MLDRLANADAYGGAWASGGIGRIALHAAAGCASAATSGGDCGRGAVTAGLTKATGAHLPDSSSDAINTLKYAVIGGTVEVIGGGKFANGATTGAFQYLFNAAVTKSGYLYRVKGVHHMMSSSVARDMGFSEAAIKEFDISGLNPRLYGQGHAEVDGIKHWGGKEDSYNAKLREFIDKVIKDKGIDPKTATTEQAKIIMQEIRYNAPTEIMQFNRTLHMRQALKEGLLYWPGKWE
jgi:hypothetical protein